MLNRTIVSVIGAFTLILALWNPAITKAADDTTRSVSVLPPSFELYANPGDSVSEKIRVRNESAVDSTYQIVVEDFKAVGEEGGVDLIDNQSNTTYSLAKWVFPEPKNFSIAAGKEKEIPYTINVPKNAEPGGHYGSILITMGNGSPVAGGSGAAVVSRVGSLILLRVSGNVKEEANLLTFKSDKSYYEKGPVSLTLRVKDIGNNHIRPKGTIVVTNLFGQKVAEIDLNGLNVLPGAIRKMDTVWKPKGFLASRYTATLVSTYGTNSKSLSSSTSFIIFPKFMIVISIALILIILFAITNKKQVKKIIHNLTK